MKAEQEYPPQCFADFILRFRCGGKAPFIWHQNMGTHVTKNDLYAAIVKIGIDKRYVVIPEFRVFLPHRKEIDLVWVSRKSNDSPNQNCDSLDYWNVHATFEIDACDVRNIEGKEFARHIRDLPLIKNIPPLPIRHFIVLYTNAYDRNWYKNRDVDKDIEDRTQLAKGKDVMVIDGRNLAEISDFPAL